VTIDDDHAQFLYFFLQLRYVEIESHFDDGNRIRETVKIEGKEGTFYLFLIDF